MRISRKIWGGLVLALGILWFCGGLFGFFGGQGQATLILVFCGFVLTRMGWSMTREKK